jgi:hypothetical protein
VGAVAVAVAGAGSGAVAVAGADAVATFFCAGATTQAGTAIMATRLHKAAVARTRFTGRL